MVAPFPATVYRETLTKGKFDEFDKSGSNRQTNKRLYILFSLLREYCIEYNIIRGSLVLRAAIRQTFFCRNVFLTGNLSKFNNVKLSTCIYACFF